MAPIYLVTDYGLTPMTAHEKKGKRRITIELPQEEAAEIDKQIREAQAEESRVWRDIYSPLMKKRNEIIDSVRTRAEEQRKARMKAKRAGPVGVCQKCKRMVKQEFIDAEGKHTAPTGAVNGEGTSTIGEPCGGEVLKGVEQ